MNRKQTMLFDLLPIILADPNRFKIRDYKGHILDKDLWTCDLQVIAIHQPKDSSENVDIYTMTYADSESMVNKTINEIKKNY